MLILAGRYEVDGNTPKAVAVSWSVYGLISIADLPAWFIQFYAAATHLVNGLYKPALLDYAVAFELFLESFLRMKLTARFGTIHAEYLLRKGWRVEDRCKDILQLATGHRMTDRNDVFQPWDIFVRRPRNELAHGQRIDIDNIAVESAHQATYQAIRWIETLDE